jgi:hypothetical protein
MAQLDVLDTGGAQFRVGYNSTNYAELSVSSGGDLTIAPTGGDTTITGTLAVSSKLTVTGPATFNSNVGIGTSDVEAWAGKSAVIQLGGRGALVDSTGAEPNTELWCNAYYDGSSKYRTTGVASLLQLVNGGFGVLVAPSGTIDTAITWTTALQTENAANAVLIRVGGALKRIEVGAVDSAGAGYRALRVLN